MPEYDADFYGWANEQAALLRAGRLADADTANIAEEIEGMGRSAKRELVNRFSVLLRHLLRWQVQPNLRGTSWRLTIEDQRDRLQSHLADNPSLRGKLADAIAQAYRLALRTAQQETGLDRDAFLAVNPWTPEQLLDESYYPQ